MGTSVFSLRPLGFNPSQPKMRKIGFDAKRLYNNTTGLGNYSRTLLRNLSEYFPNEHYFLFSPKIKKHPLITPFSKDPAFNSVFPNTRFKNYWRSYSIVNDLKKKEIDLYHGLSHELPFGIEKTNIRTVVTIHDLIIKTWPKTFPWFDRQIYNHKFSSSCKRADQIIAISESTKNDIVNYYRVDPKRVKVVHQTCSDIFKLTLNENLIRQVLEKHQLPTSYLLYVGSIIERKNLLGLLQAIHQLPKSLNIPLVVIGKGNSYLKKVQTFIATHGLQPQVFFPKNISTEELSAIYQGAEIFCYPSFYEGFGIPIIEALYSRTPVLTSDLSSLPEAAGQGAFYANPHKAESISEGIQKILTDGNYRQNLIDNGYTHVQKFNAKDLTERMMGVYRRLLD